LSDPGGSESRPPIKRRPVVIKDADPSLQAERLIKVRREITRAEEMTRIEQIEAEAREKADAMLAKARVQAEEMVTKARQEADSIRTNAREQGELDAKREALERLRGLISLLEERCRSLAEARADFLKSNLPGIIDFACALAGKILICEMRTRPDAVARRAQALLDRMPPGTPVTLSVSPDDLDVIERYLQETGTRADSIIPSLRSDPSIASGGMRLESDSGLIDARLLEALEGLGELLVEQARQRAESPLTGEAPDAP
jgi:flagellar biosynthesis/type III secretory pathway protein FliH